MHGTFQPSTGGSGAANPNPAVVMGNGAGAATKSPPTTSRRTSSADDPRLKAYVEG